MGRMVQKDLDFNDVFFHSQMIEVPQSILQEFFKLFKKYKDAFKMKVFLGECEKCKERTLWIQAEVYHDNANFFKRHCLRCQHMEAESSWGGFD